MVFWVAKMAWTMVMSPSRMPSCHGGPCPRASAVAGAGDIVSNLEGVARLLMLYAHHKQRALANGAEMITILTSPSK
jgi:hypothetical protein